MRHGWWAVAGVGVALALAGCSDNGTGEVGSLVDNEPGDDTGGGPGPIYEPRGPQDTPIELLEVDTGVSNDGPYAGEQIEVFCTVEGLREGQEAPETRWEVFEAPEGIEHAPEISGNMLTLKSVGEYKVRCVIVETEWSDPTPQRVTVGPGPAAEIDTSISPTTIDAGKTADVFCSGRDEYGNAIEDDWEVLIESGGPDPGEEGGLIEANLKLKGLVVGTYEVACQQKGALAVDETPETVTVVHGLPYRLVTTLGAPAIIAGGQTSVTCHAEDKQGNQVPDLPMTIHIPSALQLVGFNVTGTITGKFAVKCVPAALDWNAFVLDEAILDVQPDAPVTMHLELQPPKPFFAVFEKFTVLVIAEDQFGNPVPNAEILPLEIDPDGFHKDFPGNALLFKEEGFFNISGRLANDPSVVDTLEVAIEGAAPTVTVTYPARGATIVGLKPSVTVEGLANDTITGIQSVTVNGFEATIHDDGTFSQIIIPRWGMNILDIVAVDGAGDETAIKQTFYFAERYYEIAPDTENIPDSIKLWLSKDFIDDGVHNPTQPNDLATILEGVFAGLDLTSILPDDTDIGGGYKLKLSNLKFNPPFLSLNPDFGRLDLYVEIKNFYMKVKLVGECKVLGIDLCPDLSGSVSVDKMKLDADLMAAAEEGVLDIALANPDIDLEYIDIDIDGILGWLFDWLIDFFVNIFSGMIEDLVQDQLAGTLEDTLADLIENLAISETFDIDPLVEGMDPISLTLDSRIWTLQFTPDGGRLGLAARMLTANKVPHVIEGAIARGTCIKGWPTKWALPGTDNFEIALYDDFLNQALASIWQSGVFKMSIDAAEAAGGGEGGFDLGGLPIDGVLVNMDALLPPIINGCNEDGLVILQLGDLFLDVDLASILFEGGVGELGVYLAVEMSAEIALIENDEGDPAISLTILGLDTIEYHWEYVPTEFEGAEESLELLIETELIDALLGDLIGEPIFDFAIPEIDLGDLAGGLGGGGGGGGSPATVIAPYIDEMSRTGGHTLLQGYLE